MDKRTAEAIRKIEKQVEADRAGVFNARTVLELLKRELADG